MKTLYENAFGETPLATDEWKKNATERKGKSFNGCV